MKQGIWHQCGDRSQKLVQEQLSVANGIGVVVSPRDLSFDKAQEYTEAYRAFGADLLVDQQFYSPGFSNDRLGSYPINDFRLSISALNRVTDAELVQLQQQLVQINGSLRATAVLAPAVVYEAGRMDIARLNARLFSAARGAANDLGLPVYATVVLGRSVTGSQQTIDPVISQVTTLSADGWYYAFEFQEDRVPFTRGAVHRCCATGLALACTGKPVLHAYAGPMALLSPAFGARAAAIGHSQNLWQFSRERWEQAVTQGGGGNAPARYFSSGLWGTIIRPDETAQLVSPTLESVFQVSPFTTPWDRWQANKHLVYTLGMAMQTRFAGQTARNNILYAQGVLQNAVALHNAIRMAGIQLLDNTDSYQVNWLAALADLSQNQASDLDYLELVS